MVPWCCLWCLKTAAMTKFDDALPMMLSPARGERGRGATRSSACSRDALTRRRPWLWAPAVICAAAALAVDGAGGGGGDEGEGDGGNLIAAASFLAPPAGTQGWATSGPAVRRSAAGVEVHGAGASPWQFIAPRRVVRTVLLRCVPGIARRRG
jgi:hypothetical protein